MSRTSTALALVAAALIAAVCSPAAWAGTKLFSVQVPEELEVSGGAQRYDVTVTNLSSSQTLGSFDFYAPAYEPAGSNLVVIGATGPGTTTVEGQKVSVRDARIEPGRFAVLELTVNASELSGAWTSSVAAKQANDFKGTGNDFTLDTTQSDLSTDFQNTKGTSTTCAEDEPCEVSISHVVDGTTISLHAVAEAGAAGDLTAELPTKLDSPPPIASSEMDVVGTEPVDEGRQLDCLTLTEVSPVTGRVTAPEGRAKLVTFTIDGVAPLPPAANICYAAPSPTVTPDGLPFPDRGWVLFPAVPEACREPKSTLSACVDARHDGDNHVYDVHSPAGLPDPLYRG